MARLTIFAARRRMRADCPLPSVATAGGLRTFSLGRGAVARHNSAAMDGPRGLIEQTKHDGNQMSIHATHSAEHSAKPSIRLGIDRCHGPAFCGLASGRMGNDVSRRFPSLGIQA